MDEPKTEFDYLFNRYTAAAQAEHPVDHDYGTHRRALYAYVGGLETQAREIEALRAVAAAARGLLLAVNREMDPVWNCNSYHPTLAPAAESLRQALGGDATSSLTPDAWMHEEDSSRVISAIQKDQAIRDGRASASSVRAHSIPLTKI